MGIIWTLIIGLMAGAAAKLLMPGRGPGGFIIMMLLGVAGAFLATYLGQAIGWYQAGQGAGFIGAVIGAVMILLLMRLWQKALPAQPAATHTEARRKGNLFEARRAEPLKRMHSVDLRGPPEVTGTEAISDVFVSYASADRERAKALAQALTAQGWFVWWDRTIPFGKRYDKVIVDAIAGTRCVLVLWSTASIVSDWVREEAEQGRKRGILVPVMIENVEPPMGFRLFQAAELFEWDGSDTDPVFKKLLDDLAAVIGRRPAQEERSILSTDH